MYGKSLRTYEGTDKSRSPGIPNLNFLPEGRGPLKISRGDFLVNSQMKAKNAVALPAEISILLAHGLSY